MGQGAHPEEVELIEGSPEEAYGSTVRVETRGPGTQQASLAIHRGKRHLFYCAMIQTVQLRARCVMCCDTKVVKDRTGYQT